MRSTTILGVARLPPPLRAAATLRRATASPVMTDVATLFANPAADPIATAFEIVTFFPQPVWLLLVLLPKWRVTRRLMEPIGPIAGLALAHLAIVALATQGTIGVDTAPLELFNNLFDSQADGLATYLELGTYRNFAAEEWTHVLIWDLFVGRYIWLDGLRRGIFTSHSVLLTNLIGPPGLLCHLITCLVLGKGMPPEAVADTGSYETEER